MHSILGAYVVHALLQRKKSNDRASIVRDLQSFLQMSIDKTPVDIAQELIAQTLVVIKKLREQVDAWNGDALAQFAISKALRSVSHEIEQVIITVGEIFYHPLTQSFIQFKIESLSTHWENCVIGICSPGHGRHDNIEIAERCPLW